MTTRELLVLSDVRTRILAAIRPAVLMHTRTVLALQSHLTDCSLTQSFRTGCLLKIQSLSTFGVRIPDVTS